MDLFEQTDAFRFDLQKLLNRYLQEFDLPIETLFGVFETTKMDSFIDPPTDITDGPCEWGEDNNDNNNPFDQNF
jgi:hypothetical protein